MSRKVTLTLLIIFLGSILAACNNIQYRLNEDSAIDSLMKIRKAEVSYKERTGKYGDLKALSDARLIDASLASGNRYGYRFDVRVKGDSYIAVAIPAVYGKNAYHGTGGLSFYLDSSGIIRGAEKKGAEADSNAPKLAEEYQRDN